jgi:hypothetical protein
MSETIEKLYTGKDVISAGGWAECRICYDAFRRQRLTARYCKHCENGFCEGEHGNFSYQHGTCVSCGTRKDYVKSAIYTDLTGKNRI